MPFVLLMSIILIISFALMAGLVVFAGSVIEKPQVTRRSDEVCEPEERREERSLA